MTKLQSMVSNLTLPYRQGAYVQEIELGYRTTGGITPIPDYTLDEYAVRYGVAPWDIQPLYLVAPRFDLGDDYACLSFDVLGWPQDQPWPEVRVPARTSAGESFIIPLGEDVTGLTRLTALCEFPEPGPDAPLGRERWQLMLIVGNLARLLWALGREKATLDALVQHIGAQRQLATAEGYSLDLIGEELRVPRLLPSPYPIDPATIALYHLNRVSSDLYDLTTVDDRVIDETGRHHGTNEGAQRGLLGRIDRAFGFRSGDLPHPRCAAEHGFQMRLREGNWDPSAGEREVREGPYRRYGYREGAITVTAPDDQPHGVWVNDEAENPAARGQLTRACYGFVPHELDKTMDRFRDMDRPIQAAIDYFGHWWGRPEDWFTQTYAQHGVDAPHDRCPLTPTPLTYVRVPNHDAFDIHADGSFTVEAFVLPEPTADMRLRVIAIKSHEIFCGGLMTCHCVEGWALTMGTLNCIPNNVAFSISDLRDDDEAEHGARIITLTADLDLGDGAWHHVAGVIDRRYQVARLYVDGVERACQGISQIGRIVNQEDILLGVNDYHFDAPFDGLIDEVRLSNVARRDFRPALGESDDRYRTRLSIYRPWLIPTIDNIRDGLRRLLSTSPFGREVPAPEIPHIDVIEQDSTRLCTEQLFRIRPLYLPPGGHIDLEGDRAIHEEAACGPRDEYFFAWQLLTHDHPQVTYADGDAQRMQLATARSLDTLARLLAPWQTRYGQTLRVVGAFRPGADPLRAVGRALHLTMEGVPPGVLAAFAHKACFDYVEHQAGGMVRAAVREEIDKLEIATRAEVAAAVTTGDWPGRGEVLQTRLGDTPLDLIVARPEVPDARYFKWLLVECGPGRGELRAAVGVDNDRRWFVPTAPGRVIVKVEYRWQGVIVAGRREIRISLESLPPCESIGGDGALGVSQAEAAGEPGGFFHEALLLTHDDPGGRVVYGTPANRRMQLGLERALNRLLELIDGEPDVAGRLRILQGYDPDAEDLARVGRKLMLVHEDSVHMPLGRLAALAHDAGFAWVLNPPYPEGIFVASGPEPALEIIAGPVEWLAPNAVVNWLGIMRGDLPEAPTLPGTGFDALDPANRHDDPRVAYTDALCHLMTPATQNRLDALLDRLDAEGTTGQLRVLAAFDDLAPNRRATGTALKMRHDTVSLARLGALAHQARFDYVKYITVPGVDPVTHYLYASVWRGEDLAVPGGTYDPEIVDYRLLDTNDYQEIAEGAVRQVCLRPDVLAWTPPPVVTVAPPGGAVAAYAHAEEEEVPAYLAPLPQEAGYYWCLTRYGPGQARLDSVRRRHCKLLTAEKAAVIGVRGEFVLGDATDPYRFDLVVKPDEQGWVPPIPKLVYDDLMNFLEFRHPVGVEARTLALRPHVPELMADRALHDAATEHTYPSYRLRQETVCPREVRDPDIREVHCACPPRQGDSS
jgi:hypothetical protein